jgi:ABC-type glycerol-3-phosphate transport system substrate-binding protein
LFSVPAYKFKFINNLTRIKEKMMKKLTTFAFALVLGFGLVGCAGKTAAPSKTGGKTGKSSTAKSGSDHKSMNHKSMSMKSGSDHKSMKK